MCCNNSGSTQTTTSQQQIPPEYLQAYSNLLQRANTVANQPLQQYQGQMIAGFTPQQIVAFQTTSNAQNAANPYLVNAQNYVNQSAQGIAGQAPQLSQDQMAGLAGNSLGSLYGSAYSGANAGQLAQSSAALQGQAAQGVYGQIPKYDAATMAQYMSPYTQSVVNSTLGNINEQNAEQQQSVVGNAISKGAWGGDRAGIAQAELARQQDLAKNQTIAGIEQQGFQNAQGQLNQQQQIAASTLGTDAARQAQIAAQQQGVMTGEQALQLQAGQAGLGAYGQNAATQLGALQGDAWRQAQAGFAMGQLGQEQQNTMLTGANAQLQTGALQQQLAQEGLNIPYQQYLQQQAYPFQTTSWLSGITQGLGGGSGGTSSTTSPAPSTLSQLGGLGVAGLSLIGATGGYGQNGWFSNLFNKGGAVPGFAVGGGLPTVPDVSIDFVPNPQNPVAGKGPPPPPGMPGAGGNGFGGGTPGFGGQLQSLASSGALKGLAGMFGGSTSHDFSGADTAAGLTANLPDAGSYANLGAAEIIPGMSRGGVPHYEGGGEVAGVTGIPGFGGAQQASTASGGMNSAGGFGGGLDPSIYGRQSYATLPTLSDTIGPFGSRLASAAVSGTPASAVLSAYNTGANTLNTLNNSALLGDMNPSLTPGFWQKLGGVFGTNDLSSGDPSRALNNYETRGSTYDSQGRFSGSAPGLSAISGVGPSTAQVNGALGLAADANAGSTFASAPITPVDRYMLPGSVAPGTQLASQGTASQGADASDARENQIDRAEGGGGLRFVYGMPGQTGSHITQQAAGGGNGGNGGGPGGGGNGGRSQQEDDTEASARGGAVRARRYAMGGGLDGTPIAGLGQAPGGGGPMSFGTMQQQPQAGFGFAPGGGNASPFANGGGFGMGSHPFLAPAQQGDMMYPGQRPPQAGFGPSQPMMRAVPMGGNGFRPIGAMSVGGAVDPGQPLAGFDLGGAIGGLPNNYFGDPNAQAQFANYAAMPTEKLQEMAVQVPPGSPQGDMIHRALVQKQMQPGMAVSIGGGMRRGGLVAGFAGGGDVTTDDDGNPLVLPAPKDLSAPPRPAAPPPAAPQPGFADMSDLSGRGPGALNPAAGLGTPPPAAPAPAAPAAPVDHSARATASNPWMPLLAAGLGMMASRSHTALGGLGEGGMQGLKYVTDQQAAERAQQAQDQQAAYQKSTIDLGNRNAANTERNTASEIETRAKTLSQSADEVRQRMALGNRQADIQSRSTDIQAQQAAQSGEYQRGQLAVGNLNAQTQAQQAATAAALAGANIGNISAETDVHKAEAQRAQLRLKAALSDNDGPIWMGAPTVPGVAPATISTPSGAPGPAGAPDAASPAPASVMPKPSGPPPLNAPDGNAVGPTQRTDAAPVPPASGAPASGAAPAPRVLNIIAEVQRLNRLADTSPGAKERAAQLQAMIQNGRTYDESGAIVPMPGYAEAAAADAMPKAIAEQVAKVDGDRRLEIAKGAQDATGMKAIADVLRRAGDQYPTGPGTPTKLAAEKLSQSALEAIGVSPNNELYKGLSADTTMGDIINKFGTQLAAKQARAGGDRAFAALGTFAAANPNLTLSEGGYKAIVRYVDTSAQQLLDQQDFAAKYRGDPRAFETELRKAYPPEMYASRVLPIDTPTPADQRIPGAYYLGQKGTVWKWDPQTRFQQVKGY